MTTEQINIDAELEKLFAHNRLILERLLTCQHALHEIMARFPESGAAFVAKIALEDSEQ
jgi:hypothetical protein